MLHEFTLQATVESATKTEQLGRIFYTVLVEKFADDREIKELFTILAGDERKHEVRFAALREKLPENSMPFPQQLLVYLRAMSLSKFFVGEERLLEDAGKIKKRDDALQRALQLEKDTLSFYRAASEILDDPDMTAALDQIIEEEKRHTVKVMEYLITDAKMRGLDDAYEGASPE